jgi:hypothetical protein
MKFFDDSQHSNFSIAVFSLVLFLVFLLQSQFIYPIEANFRNDPYVHLVSLMYIPHGVKVLFLMYVGIKAVVPIFLLLLLNGFLFSSESLLNIQYILLGAFGGVLTMGLPLFLLNKLINKPYMAGLFFTGKLNYFWAFLFLAISSSFLNGLWHAILYDATSYKLNVLFIAGDIIGAVTFLGVLMFLLKMFSRKIKWGN